MIRKIFIPVDFSEAAGLALAYGIELSKKLRRASSGTEGSPAAPEVEVLHCYEIPAMTGPDGSILVGPERATEIMDDATERLKKFVNAVASDGVSISQRIRQGPPAETILQRAKEAGADLIIMGTHGRQGLSRFFLGSVAEQVLRSAEIPVLTMRPKEE